MSATATAIFLLDLLSLKNHISAIPGDPLDMSGQVEGWLGWEEDPPDEDVVRARTKLGQLRVWRLPRGALSQINGKDFAGPLIHPGLYILVDNETREAYIGESIDVKKRLGEHDKSPPKELKDWSNIIAIGDGRGHYQSMLTETTVRLQLEKTAIRYLAGSGILQPVNKVKEEPKMSVALQTVAQRLEEELQFVFEKLGITQPVTRKKVPSGEIRPDLLRSLMADKKYRVTRTVIHWLIAAKPLDLTE